MAKRKRKNTLIWVLLAVVALLIVAVVISQKNKPKGEKVTTEEVTLRTIKEMVAASGKVFPVTEVKISSDVSGEIVELYVEEGDSVVLGQLLANIDPDAYQSQVERGVAGVNSAKAQVANSRSQIENLKAQREQIEAQLVNAREIHERNEKLKKDGVISDADYETSLANLRGLEANFRSSEAGIKSAQESARAAEFSVQSAEATLRELRTSLKRTAIYAPTNGIVSMLNVEKGERVVGTIQMAGTEMMRIADLNDMEVRVDVSENDIPRVSIGDIVEIEVDAYLDRIFIGYVTQIANSASNSAVAALTSDQVTNFEVRIKIDPDSYKDLLTPEKPYPFRPGMSASVEVNTETIEDILSVPIQAVTTREKKEKNKNAKLVNQSSGIQDDLLEVVFACSGDTVRMAEVVTGIQDDTYIQIKSGLEEGEEIVTAPYSAISRKLKEGDTIQRENKDKKDDEEDDE